MSYFNNLVRRLSFSIILLTGTTAAADLVGINAGGRVYRIDPTNGSFEIVNDSGLNFANALAHDSNGRLLLNGLYELDPTTGTGSLFVSSPGNIRALSFAADDTLYAIENRSTDGDRDYLLSVDLTSGAVTEIGFTGRTGIQSMAFGPNGTLYANDLNRGLGTVNLTTGFFSDVSSSLGGANIQGMAFDDMGNLFGADTSRLYSIDPTSGSHTLIGNTGPFIRGLAFSAVPEPSAFLFGLIVLVGFAYLDARRRQKVAMAGQYRPLTCAVVAILAIATPQSGYGDLIAPNDGYTGEYHVIFTTSDVYASFSGAPNAIGGVSGANASVQARASSGSKTSGAGLNFVALISDSSQDMANLIGDSFPIYNTRGDRVSNTFAALFSPPVSPFARFDWDENGNLSSGLDNYFSGSNTDGTSSGLDCNDWTAGGSALVDFGNASSATDPVHNEVGFLRCSSQMHLAGVSVNTAAVPEPSAFLFGLIVLVGFAYLRWAGPLNDRQLQWVPDNGRQAPG